MSGMNIGICRKTALGLAALTVLSACSEGPVFDLLQSTGTTPESTPIIPLVKAQMVEGAVTLVPPSGYCIDPSSLTHIFALMARCDVLDAKNEALDAPLGLITASLAKNRGQTLTAADVALASNANVIETLNRPGLKIVRAETRNPPKGLAKVHYRAATQIEGYDLSLALFSPIESEAQGSRGALMLQNLVKASQDASVATNQLSQTRPPKKGFRTTISGLFD